MPRTTGRWLLFAAALWGLAALLQCTWRDAFAGGRPEHLARRRAVSLAAGGAPAAAVRRVLVPIAQDSEEIETACITDVLVRAGAEVTVASVEPELQVRMSRGLKIVADTLIGDCAGQEWDAIVLPGGMPGAERLADCGALTALLKEQGEARRLIAAVCASPAVVLAEHGLLDERATCYPADKFKKFVAANCQGWWDSPVVVDRKVITSQGPGTSLQFALKLVEVLYGKAKAEELAGQLLTKTVLT